MRTAFRRSGVQAFRRSVVRSFGRSGRRRGPSVFAAVVVALLTFGPLAEAQKKKPLAKPEIGPVTIDQYSQLLWRPEDNYFRSPGPVRITLTDAVTGEKTVLIADDAEGSPTGDIVVRGKIRLDRAEGTLTGRALTYRASDQTGTVLDARAELANMLVAGKKIELLPDQSARATGASFTTCIKHTPDYHITAREILVSPDRTVRAKHIGFYIKGTKILSLPSFKRSFKRTVRNPIPLPAYSKENFLQFHFSDSLVETPKTALGYDVRISLRRLPEGEVRYEHDLGDPDDEAPPPDTRRLATQEPLRSALETPRAVLSGAPEESESRRTTLFALVTSDNYVYNRKRTDIRISRLPEVGLSLRNMFNRQPPGAEDATTVLGHALHDPGKWQMNGEAAVGFYSEHPSNASQTRLGSRVDAASPFLRLGGPVYARYGATVWSSLYGDGSAYSIVAPEAEVDFLLRRNTFIGAAFRYMQDFGRTPFLFDRRDIEQEMRLRYGFLGASWAYDLEVRYDMERARAYDTSFAIRRRFDCMEIGVAYRTRDQGLSLVLNLLPGAVGVKRP